jgi:hypothetical protein
MGLRGLREGHYFADVEAELSTLQPSIERHLRKSESSRKAHKERERDERARGYPKMSDTRCWKISGVAM